MSVFPVLALVCPGRPCGRERWKFAQLSSRFNHL